MIYIDIEDKKRAGFSASLLGISGSADYWNDCNFFKEKGEVGGDYSRIGVMPTLQSTFPFRDKRHYFVNSSQKFWIY